MSFVVQASQIAARAHAGQVYGTGSAAVPYVHHCERVAGLSAAVCGLAGLSPALGAAAGWLHDVVEDTMVSAGKLSRLGVPQMVVDTVVLLTHRRGVARAQYLQQVCSDPLAACVKLADSLVNADPVANSVLAASDPIRAARLRGKYCEGVLFVASRVPARAVPVAGVLASSAVACLSAVDAGNRDAVSLRELVVASLVRQGAVRGVFVSVDALTGCEDPVVTFTSLCARSLAAGASHHTGVPAGVVGRR